MPLRLVFSHKQGAPVPISGHLRGSGARAYASEDAGVGQQEAHGQARKGQIGQATPASASLAPHYWLLRLSADRTFSLFSANSGWQFWQWWRSRWRVTCSTAKRFIQIDTGIRPGRLSWPWTVQAATQQVSLARGRHTTGVTGGSSRPHHMEWRL